MKELAQIIRLLEALVAAANGSTANEKAPVVEQAHVAAAIAVLRAEAATERKTATVYSDAKADPVARYYRGRGDGLTRAIEVIRNCTASGGNNRTGHTRYICTSCAAYYV